MYEGFGVFVVVALLRCWIEVQNTDHLCPFETKRIFVNVELMSILITIWKQVHASNDIGHILTHVRCVHTNSHIDIITCVYNYIDAFIMTSFCRGIFNYVFVWFYESVCKSPL